jgi:hypothetical protein
MHDTSKDCRNDLIFPEPNDWTKARGRRFANLLVYIPKNDAWYLIIVHHGLIKQASKARMSGCNAISLEAQQKNMALMSIQNNKILYLET